VIVETGWANLKSEGKAIRHGRLEGVRQKLMLLSIGENFFFFREASVLVLRSFS
jgi:hypothetical protein